jgi:hypothetical protein
MIRTVGDTVRHFAAICLLLLPWTARSAEIVDPAGIELSGAYTEPEVRRGVRLALLNRHWTPTNERERRVEALFTRDTLWVRIVVEYTANAVTVRYVASEGLDYEEEDGEREIHGTYNRWIGGLLKDIPILIERARVASADEPAPVEATPIAPAPPAEPAAAAATPVLEKGGRATPAAGAKLYPRALVDAKFAKAVREPVVLKLPVTNAAGRWWFVSGPEGSGWMLESDLRPG